MVASEISNLAGQTTVATEDITKLIADIGSELDRMINTIENLLKTGEEESICAAETAKNFSKISRQVDGIGESAGELSEIVARLSGANKEIVQNIQTISAITEEVTSHATMTLESSEQNQRIVNHITEMMEQLSSDAGQLKE